LKDYPEDYENFVQIKDKINLYSDFEQIGLKCSSCGSFRHTFDQCFYIHFVPNKAKLLYSSNHI